MFSTRVVDFTIMQLSGKTSALTSFKVYLTRIQELIYSLYSLYYVPSDHVNEYYHEVITKLVDDGEEKDDEWKDYKEKIDAFSSYYRMTWIEKRGGRVAHFKPEL